MLLGTRQKYICISISRPRRFGKTMATEMLAAYYGYAQNTDILFEGLNVSKDASYQKHLNKYNCILLNMQEFLSSTSSVEEMLLKIKNRLKNEFNNSYERINYLDPDDFVQVMKDVYTLTNRKFVILIDEWDCLFREYRDDIESQKNMALILLLICSGNTP